MIIKDECIVISTVLFIIDLFVKRSIESLFIWWVCSLLNLRRSNFEEIVATVLFRNF